MPDQTKAGGQGNAGRQGRSLLPQHARPCKCSACTTFGRHSLAQHSMQYGAQPVLLLHAPALCRRPAAMKQSGIGHTTTLQFQQTKKYMEPLYERLKHRALHEELRAGLWMMVEVRGRVVDCGEEWSWDGGGGVEKRCCGNDGGGEGASCRWWCVEKLRWWWGCGETLLWK